MAATTAKEKEKDNTVTVKNFKSSTDVTDFYRYIHENNLRAEAKEIIAVVLKKITPPKKRGRKKVLQ